MPIAAGSTVIPLSPSAKTAGFVSAALATAFSLIYIVAQIAEWLGWLGSHGGPESLSTPIGIIVLLTPSLLLGSSFLVLAVSVHQLAAPARRVWSHAAIAFATAYAVLTGLVYFGQLTVVAPRMARGDLAGIEPFVFVPFESFLYAVDLLGYSFMSVATLFMARVFTGDGPERAARWFLTANGLLLPFLIFQMYWHSLIWGGALWAITFPGATIALALVFQRASVLDSADATTVRRRDVVPA